MTDICDICGEPLQVGYFPFCPHGKSTLTTIPDDVPGGFIAENGFSEPRTFYSKSAHRAALAAEGYEIRAKWAGPHDKYLTRWDSVDLDAARALVTPRPKEAPLPITVENAGAFTEKDLE